MPLGRAVSRTTWRDTGHAPSKIVCGEPYGQPATIAAASAASGSQPTRATPGDAPGEDKRRPPASVANLSGGQLSLPDWLPADLLFPPSDVSGAEAPPVGGGWGQSGNLPLDFPGVSTGKESSSRPHGGPENHASPAKMPLVAESPLSVISRVFTTGKADSRQSIPLFRLRIRFL
jgi:hypothetical protein